MNWHIRVTKTAEKQLKRLPKSHSGKIEKIIDEMESNPFLGDIKKLGGTGNSYRRRVGSYRILYDMNAQEKMIEIHEIIRRTSNTY